jgi:hypothetical protein
MRSSSELHQPDSIASSHILTLDLIFPYVYERLRGYHARSEIVNHCICILSYFNVLVLSNILAGREFDIERGAGVSRQP